MPLAKRNTRILKRIPIVISRTKKTLTHLFAICANAAVRLLLTTRRHTGCNQAVPAQWRDRDNNCKGGGLRDPVLQIEFNLPPRVYFPATRREVLARLLPVATMGPS